MTRSLGWGLVGASTIAHEWVIDAIRAVPDNEVVAVFSTDPERGARYASSHRIPSAYASLSALVRDPQVGAVYVSTTNEMHRAQTVEAAAAGKHVLCEKPLALSVAEAREMIDACSRAGVVLGTNHHLREAASHRKIRELIQSGAVGKPAPESRGRNGDRPGDPKGPKKNDEPPNNCPTTMWTVPLEIKGLACILLLPKPEKQGGADGGSSSGLGGLLG